MPQLPIFSRRSWETNAISIIFICNILILTNINRKLCVVVAAIIGDSETYFAGAEQFMVTGICF